MTLDLDWQPIAGASLALPAAELELGEGRLLDVVLNADDPAARRRLDVEESPLALGRSPTGRVRVRLEAPLSATLTLRFGRQSAALPLASLVDGPLRTAIPNLAEVEASRAAWDSLEVRPADPQFDGTAAPGSVVALLIAPNILTPEPAEVRVALTAELRPVRGGEPVWKLDRQEFAVATNGPPLPRSLSLPVPRAEGTYVLEIRATWLPAEGVEGSRLARLWRKRRQAEPPSATRRLSLAVLGPKGTPIEPAVSAIPSDLKVDVVDLTRNKGTRPIAGGHAPRPVAGWAWDLPDSAWVAPGRFDRIKGLLPKVGSDLSLLPGGDSSGITWAAIGLKVPRPGRAHRLTVTLLDGQPSSLGVALVAAGPEGRPRLLLDACAATGPIATGSPPQTLSWPVWPDATDPVVVLVNRGSGPVRVGAVDLTELAGGLPPAFVGDTPGDAPREIGLDLSAPRALDRFGGGSDDPVGLGRNLGSYLAHCGATAVVLPRPSPRAAPDAQGDEDALAADRLDVLLRMLERHGVAAWIDLPFDGPLPGLPVADSAEAVARGLALVDRFGQGAGGYNPLHPEVRDAMTRRLTEVVAIRKSRANLAGVLVRLGPAPTLPGSPEVGLDDATFARFVREKLDEATARGVPGLKHDDPRRFAARHQFVTGAGRGPWLSWRSQQVAGLYAGLAKAARQASGAALMVATPTVDDGPAGREARHADVAGIAADQAWRAVGLDLADWPAGEGAPVVLRGVGVAADDLARDLATSPELDARVAARPDRGLIVAAVGQPGPSGPNDPLRLAAPAVAEGTAGEEFLGHAVAAVDARRILVSGAVAAGREERLRDFARVFRALPIAAAPPPPRLASGVAVRSWNRRDATWIALANDTPYPITLDLALAIGEGVAVEDVGRSARLEGTAAGGTRRFAVDLAPFGVAALRAKAAGVTVAAASPRHGDAVKAQIEAQSRELSGRLTRLVRNAEAAAGPPNPGFEAEGPRPGQEIRVATSTTGLVGWKAAGAGAVEIDADRPHSGQGSLRVAATGPTAAALSEAFVPPAGSALTARFWLRAEPAGATVRFRLDGEAGGQALARQADLTPGEAWNEFAVRVGDLPAAGLDRARLRFELLAPGKVWVDDLTLGGSGPSESERLNARRRTILAAVQAYRERRYADFARLANSHWAAPSPSDPDAQDPAARTGDASGTDLPPGRRLR